MTFWTVVILSVYLVVILCIGFYSGRDAGKNTESFFVANRHLNWLQESMAVFTTIAPAGALLGTIGLFYRDGGNMLGYIIGYSFLMPLTYWYIGSRLRRLGRLRGYQTQAVFIRDFYQSRYLRWGMAIVGICAAIPYFMVNPVALGYLLNRYTGFPYAAGVWLFVVLATVYTLKGGLRAVANTDIFHGILLLVFLLGAIFALVFHGGGVMRVLDTPKAVVGTSAPALGIFYSWLIYMGFGACVQPDRCFRMFAVRDESNMRRGVIMSATMVAFAAFSYFATGLAVNSFIPNITKTDETLAAGLQVAAVWLVPWFVMNAWGGGMSNFTSGMLSVANIFIKDLFEPWYVRRNNLAPGPKRDRLIILTARIFIVCMALITVGVCFYPPPFIWTLINITHGSLIQFFPVFMIGFLWRGVTRLGAQCGWTCGVLCMMLWSFVYEPPLGPLAGIDALIVNTIVLVVVSLAVPEKKELKEQREEMRRLAVSDVDSLPRTTVASPVTAD
ncbi:MAG: sodium:solute symporter family protein [Candidatus Korobacteraceae bacterium]